MTDPEQNDGKPVWPCARDEAGAAIAASTGGRTGRRAALQSAIMLAVALIFFLWLKKPVAGGLVLAMSLGVLVCGLFIPPAFKAIDRFGHKLGEWVAAGLTWLLLVPFFYLCFVPSRAILAVSGRDPLNLGFKSKAASYWTPRTSVKDLKRYERQH